jgi:hypothetical protein
MYIFYILLYWVRVQLMFPNNLKALTMGLFPPFSCTTLASATQSKAVN